MNWGAAIRQRLDAIRTAKRWREPRSFDAFGASGVRSGLQLVSFASNDYLGLTTHPQIIAAAHAAIDRWGTGATAARLIVGSRPVHDELETTLAQHHGMEAAALFSTGYQANLGVMTTFADEQTIIYSDELNHASIVDGIRLSRARKFVFPHRDLEALEDRMKRDQAAGEDRRVIIVSDVVFSMDGDLADVAALAGIAEQFNALLILDVAHLVFDSAAFHRTIAAARCPVLLVGTLSKTLASQGGYVAGSADGIALLENVARSYIFTTGLAPSAAAAARAALDIVNSTEGAALIARLRTNVDVIQRNALSPIIPIACGSEERALQAAACLSERGILVPAIRPPTVPAASSRLRVAMSALHTWEQIAHLRSALDSEIPDWSTQ
ncbi:MAG: aminotransferase class I/II-fold pyridoxal phosphate-dependent enzyme [Acidimicrobiia bacterium]